MKFKILVTMLCLALAAPAAMASSFDAVSPTDQTKPDDKKDDDKRDDDKQDGGKHDDHQDDGQENDCHKRGRDKDKQEEDCGKNDNTRPENFNLVCSYYSATAPDAYKSCKASLTFEKLVTLDGGEVADDSPEPTDPLSPEVPRFKVECDSMSEVKYNGYARRWTDLLSTRIQGLSGPSPAIYLPRGALHAGTHTADSYLEIDSGIPSQQYLRLPGKCQIWTGRALH